LGIAPIAEHDGAGIQRQTFDRRQVGRRPGDFEPSRQANIAKATFAIVMKTDCKLQALIC
jgi:hypothetical protein